MAEISKTAGPKIQIAVWVDIWADGEWKLHAPQDGLEPPLPLPLKQTKDWRRYTIFVPVPLPEQPGKEATVHHEGVQKRTPEQNQAERRGS